MNLKNKTISVTGGAGFIGSNLADRLLTLDIKKLIIIDNLCQSNLENIKHLLEDNKVEFVRADIRDYNSIENLVLESDVIFHLAASDVGTSEIFPKTNLETNVLGTFNILQAMMKKPEIRLINVSSGSVVNPSTLYSISKLTAENCTTFYAKEHGLKITSIRPHHVFGPRQNMDGTSGVINIFLKRIEQNLPPIIWGDGDQIKCFTYVEDVINALLILVKNHKTIGETYDCASDTRMSIKDLAELLIARNSTYIMEPKYTDSKVGENSKLTPDTTKLKKIGFKTKYTFKQGLELTEGWVSNQI